MAVSSEVRQSEFVDHLARCGCRMVRKSTKHLVFANPSAGRYSSVPRDPLIGQDLAAKILADLGLDHRK